MKLCIYTHTYAMMYDHRWPHGDRKAARARLWRVPSCTRPRRARRQDTPRAVCSL